MTTKIFSFLLLVVAGSMYACNYEEPSFYHGSCYGVFPFREALFFDFKDPQDSSWFERLGNQHRVERMSVTNDTDTTKYFIGYRYDYHYNFQFGQLADNRNYYLELNDSDIDTFSISTFTHTDSCYSYKVLDTLTYNGNLVFINKRIPLHYSRYHTIVIKKDYSYP